MRSVISERTRNKIFENRNRIFAGWMALLGHQCHGCSSIDACAAGWTGSRRKAPVDGPAARSGDRGIEIRDYGLLQMQ